MRKLLVIALLFVGLESQAQDIHYTQFYMNPVYLNPAMTGNFEGSYRFTAQQKSQWRSVSRPYNTFGFSAESREGWILPGLYHGLSFFHDVAGDGNFRTTEVSLATAYQLYIGKDSIHSVTPGFRVSYNNRTIDFSQFSFGSQFNGYTYDAALPTNENFGISSRHGFNASVGLSYSYKPEKRKEFTAGFGWYNIPQIKQSFFGDDGIRRDWRYLVHARASWIINEKWDAQPAIMTQFQGKFVEIVVGSNFRYVLKDRKGEYIAPYGGVFYRGPYDAINFVGGIYYNNWTVGVSYDLNMNDLTPASAYRGGFEFQVQYIINLLKPNVVQFRVCPDYL